MKDKKILIISPEVAPYLPQSDIANNSFNITKSINDGSGQTRIFMPRFGIINERRHQLHEVIRLSGINVVINNLDVPLIIKVASVPGERMQVYFIDNEDYFKRKAMLKDENGKLFEDTDERLIFFTKGVMETVKKLNWSPDIIHVHGWFTALFPMYLKTMFAEDPMFDNTKIISSIYSKDFDSCLNKELAKKITFDNIDEKECEHIKTPTYENLMESVLHFSDGIILASDEISEEFKEKVHSKSKPTLKYEDIENIKSYTEFYSEYFNE